VPVSGPELQEIFNGTDYYERVLNGTLALRFLSRNLPDPKYGQPDGTVSEKWEYIDSDGFHTFPVAVVHQYVLPDGTINNPKGLPDPKWVRIEDRIYTFKPNRRS
jgi:hypothetical protein